MGIEPTLPFWGMTHLARLWTLESNQDLRIQSPPTYQLVESRLCLGVGAVWAAFSTQAVGDLTPVSPARERGGNRRTLTTSEAPKVEGESVIFWGSNTAGRRAWFRPARRTARSVCEPAWL